MQYLGTKCYEHKDFPGKCLAPVRNRAGLRVVVPTGLAPTLSPLELYQDKAGNINVQNVLGKRSPLSSLVPLPHELLYHVVLT